MIADNFELNKEQRLLILASRINLTMSEQNEIQSIIEDGINIDYFIGLCNRHKVLNLVSQKIIANDKKNNIPANYKQIIDNLYHCNKQRNMLLFKELQFILSIFDENNLVTVPLKGTVLIPEVYRDYGVRAIGDFDFLIPIDIKDKVIETVKKIGYTPGNYDWLTREIKNAPRKAELMWKMYNGNLFPCVKKSDDVFVRFIKLDFSYDVDLKRNYRTSGMLLRGTEQGSLIDVPTRRLSQYDMIIHIALHLYKEATNAEFINMHKDLNLIKFVDLREYFLHVANNITITDLINRVHETETHEAMYFAFYYLHLIFTDDFSKEVFEGINVLDHSFIEMYGHHDYDLPKKWRKKFTDRFFSVSNVDEIEELTKFQKQKEHLDL